MGGGIGLVGYNVGPETVTRARAGNEEAIQGVIHDFVAALRSGRLPALHVRQYVVEKLEDQLRGHCRDRALGLSRRGRGRPAKRGRSLSELDRARREDPVEEHHYQLARAVARLLYEGNKLTMAYEIAADERGVGRTTVRTAWKRWRLLASLEEEAARDPCCQAIAALKDRWGEDVVVERFRELGLWDRFDAASTQAIVDFAKAGAPPAEWAVPPIDESAC